MSKTKAPVCYVLVGLPASGKTTWREKFTSDNPDTVCISSDDLVEAEAAANGSTYSEHFRSFDHKNATRKLYEMLASAVENQADVIIDRTNMSRKSRARFLSQLPKEYRRVAVNFEIDEQIRERRAQERFELTGKKVPDHAIANMRESYEIPTFDEFDSVIYVNGSERK